MAAAAPTVEGMFQQLLNSQRTTMDAIQDLSNRSMDTNARFDELLKRVTNIKVAQSLAVYPTSAPEAILNPLISNTKSSSPTNSEVDDKESSIGNPGNKEDLAAVLDAAAETPILNKRQSASDHKDRRDSYFIRQLDADENDTTIKYHTKAPDQPKSLEKIKYRDVLQHLEALHSISAQSSSIARP